MRRLVFTCLVLAAVRVEPPAAQAHHTFTVAEPSEAVAQIEVDCSRCAWDTAGQEAAMLAIAVDREYASHLPVIRRGRAVYEVVLGRLQPGRHEIHVDEDAELTARGLQNAAAVLAIDVELLPESDPRHTAISLAPIVHARPNTLGRFTDVPVFMWYEVEPGDRGTRYRYSVVFTNEDGGTPADRLMATWGRTTDIEYLYSVELDRQGAIVSDDMQGPEHEILPFRGTREGRHPLLWVVTDNNMVLDRGSTRVRYAPAPVAFPLTDVSREAVMDANPWLYRVMAQELAREEKIAADAPPGKGMVPDPRRFVHIEACGALNGAALAFAVRAGDRWIASDRGIREYRIARDGCFRAAVPLPDSLDARDVTGLRAQAYTRPASGDGPAKPAGPVRLTRVNTVFMLDSGYRPRPPIGRWQGALTMTADGPPVEIPPE